MTGKERAARQILDQLQDAVSEQDLERLAELFDDDVVMFGTAAANVDRAQTMAYVADALAQGGTIRWQWDRVMTLVEQPDLLAFSAVGTVGLDAPDGQALGERQDFRLTCLAIFHSGRWRLRHFHGSVPET